MSPTILRSLAVASAVALVTALFPMPSAFYQLLRWLVAPAAFARAYHEWKEQKTIAAVIFAVIAILFNPISPIYLTRSIWMYIDVVAAGVFGWFPMSSVKARSHPEEVR